MQPMERNPLEALAEQVRRPTGDLPDATERVKKDIGDSIAFTGGIIQFFYNLAVLVFSLFSVPAEVVLRYDFGSRHFTLMRVILGGILLSFSSKIMAFASGGALGGNFSSLVIWVYILICIAQFGWMARRPFIRQRCHSSYPGSSTLPWRMLPFYEWMGGQYNFQLYVEPLLLVTLSYVFGYLNSWLGTFLFVSGLSLFVQGYARDAAFRQRLAEIVDREIEADQLARAAQGWTDAANLQTEGYVVPSHLRYRSPEDRKGHLRKLKVLYPLIVGAYRLTQRGLTALVDLTDFSEEPKPKPPSGPPVP